MNLNSPTFYNPNAFYDNEVSQSFKAFKNNCSIAEHTASIIAASIEKVGVTQNNYHIEQTTVLKKGFSFLNQGLGNLLQEQINTNILLENIGLLLKLPDSEKQRQLHIERGIKFSLQSKKDSDLIIDAKDELEAALKLMPQDWFVLQQLGIIYLYNDEVINIPLSKEYFLKAAKYAKADSETEGIIYINNLFNQKLSNPFNKNDITIGGLKDFVREAYLSAALCSYILCDFKDAAKIALKALDQDDEHPKSLFLSAKYLARTDDKELAIINIKRAISIAPYYCVVAYLDSDLVNLPDVEIFCKKTQEDFFLEIDKILSRLNVIKENLFNADIIDLLSEYFEARDFLNCFNLIRKTLVFNDDNFEFLIVDEIGIDSLVIQAALLIIENDNASLALLQRRMKIGYSRAAKIFDDLEKYEIIGTFTSNNNRREILCKSKAEIIHKFTNLAIQYDNKQGYLIKDLNDKWNEIELKYKEMNNKDTRLMSKQLEQLSQNQNSAFEKDESFLGKFIKVFKS